MPVQITKSSIDLGIVLKNAEDMLHFYRDVVGLEFQASIPLPSGEGTMHRFLAGESIIKFLEFDKPVPAETTEGGIHTSTGYRYWTITCDNLEDCTKEIEAAGYKMVRPIWEIREGVRVSIMEDPDGNWFELIQYD